MARVLHVFGTSSVREAQEQWELLSAGQDRLRAADVALVDVDRLPEVKLSHDRANVPLGSFAVVLEEEGGGEGWRADAVLPVDDVLSAIGDGTKS